MSIGTKGLFRRGIRIASAGIIGLFSRGIFGGSGGGGGGTDLGWGGHVPRIRRGRFIG